MFNGRATVPHPVLRLRRLMNHTSGVQLLILCRITSLSALGRARAPALMRGGPAWSKSVHSIPILANCLVASSVLLVCATIHQWQAPHEWKAPPLAYSARSVEGSHCAGLKCREWQQTTPTAHLTEQLSLASMLLHGRWRLPLICVYLLLVERLASHICGGCEQTQSTQIS